METIWRVKQKLHAEGFDVGTINKYEDAEAGTSDPETDHIGNLKSNILLFAPRVFVIGQTQFNKDQFSLWMEHNHLTEMGMDYSTPLGRLWQDVSDDDAIARMIEFGGRHCYRAWEKGRDRKEYIRNILEMEHGSVLEHATINWAIQGVSRSLSLELARHRVGIALSQESQRYVDASEINFVVPPILIDMNQMGDNSASQGFLSDFLALNLEALKNYKHLQEAIAENYDGCHIDDPKAQTMVKKRANEAARAHLPNCTETRFLWTTNMRILLHFLWLRGGSGADLEIRRLAVLLLKKAQTHAPEIFGNMTTKEIPDGYGVPIIISKDA